MVARRKISKLKYLIALIISSSLFTIGLLAGNLINISKFNSINEFQERIKTQVLTLETIYDIAAQDPCNFIDSKELTNELYKLSDNLDSLESQFGKNNEEILRNLEYYSVLEVRHWIFMKQASRECNKDVNLILFFYSNNEELCTDCGAQGYVLTFLRKTYPEYNIFVYSFNTDINSGIISSLFRLYSVKKLPAIVINDKSYLGFKDRNELQKIIGIE